MDEELFFEAIIASERVARWLADLRAGTRSVAAAAAKDADAATSAARAVATAAKAAQALARAVAAENACGGPYSEAAEQQGAANALTALMSRLCAAGGAEDDDDDDDEDDTQQRDQAATTPKQSSLATTARRDALAAAGRAMAALSGPMACGGRVVAFSTDALRLPPRGAPLRVREGAISDGLGARVWALAHVALRELCVAAAAANDTSSPLVRGKDVLEIGAGTGLLGVAAARLGARSVVVSDHEPAVLRILRACAHLNARDVEEAQLLQGGDGGGDDDATLPSVHSSEAQTVVASGSDDEEEDDDDDAPSQPPPSSSPTTPPTSWDVAGGALRVRAFDWADSLALLDGEAAAAPLRLLGGPDAAADAAATANNATDPPPPTLPPNQTFDVVLGSEVMYAPEHARLVAAALAHRLGPPGSSSIAMLACAGRFAGVFEAFRDHCAERGLRYRAAPVRPTASDYSDGILARHRAAAAVVGGGARVGGGEEGGARAGGTAAANGATAAPPASAASSRVEYEGGFLLMAVDWGAEACAGRWHRDDRFVEGLVDGSAAPVEEA